MKRALITLSLWAAVIGAGAALLPRPAAASPTLPLPPPQLIQPDLKELKLPEAPKLSLPFPFPFRAELSAEIYQRPTRSPGSVWVIGVVRNTGLVGSGPFQTRLAKAYVGTPSLPGPAVAFPIAMNIPAGGYQVIYFVESAPLTVALDADFLNAVPEYDETNNHAVLAVTP
jgi:hypothetical protein